MANCNRKSFCINISNKVNIPKCSFSPIHLTKKKNKTSSRDRVLFLVVLHANQHLTCLPQQGSINMTEFHTFFLREKQVLCQFFNTTELLLANSRNVFEASQ